MTKCCPCFLWAWSSSRIRSSACASSNLAINQSSATLKAQQRFGPVLIARGSDVGGFDERTSVGTPDADLAAQSAATTDAWSWPKVSNASKWRTGSRTIRIPGVGQGACCDEDSVMAALLKSPSQRWRAIRALQSELFADECLQSNC